jgi:arsenate reductase
MATKATIWHNPRCSKSRQTLALLEERGVEIEIRLYLEDPPTAAELESALAALGMEPRDLMRKKEAVYTQQKLDDESNSRQALLAAMITHPILIERPIVFCDGKARIGRPPESVLELFESP